jgi:hypothetical protein
MSQIVQDISHAVQMQEKQISNLHVLNTNLLKKKQEQEAHLQRYNFTSDKEMLDLQMASHLSYLTRKNTILQIQTEISKLNHELALNQNSLRTCNKDLADILKENKYASMADFKMNQEYQIACHYLKSKNHQLDLSEISKNTVITKAHEMYNTDLVEKLYFNVKFEKRFKFFHKTERGYVGCAYKGGRQCNCGCPVTWVVYDYIDWSKAITFDDTKPVGKLSIE